MNIKSQKDFFSGLMFMSVGAAFAWGATKYSVGTGARRAMLIGGNLLVGTLALVAVPASWDYVRFMAREGTPVLGVPLFWVYLPFVFMLLALVLRCGFAVREALRVQSPDTELRL